MSRRALVYVCICLFVNIFIAPALFAQETADELEMRRKENKAKKSEVAEDYRRELAKVNKASDERLLEIKTDFHHKRDEILKERAAKQKELTDAYDTRIKPILEEEKRIVESLGPGKGMNFAKSKAERTK